MYIIHTYICIVITKYLDDLKVYAKNVNNKHNNIYIYKIV